MVRDFLNFYCRIFVSLYQEVYTDDRFYKNLDKKYFALTGVIY